MPRYDLVVEQVKEAIRDGDDDALYSALEDLFYEGYDRGHAEASASVADDIDEDDDFDEEC